MSRGKTVVIDYQTGNLTSACKALRTVGADVQVVSVTAEPAVLRDAARIVLPGVGHFASTGCLLASGMGEALRKRVADGIPFLGICVGLQWLCTGSTEAPETPGLGIFPAMCERFPAGIKSPHVGWNSLEITGNSRLLKGIPAASYVYFTHSFRVPKINATSTVTSYGGEFSSVLEQDNWMAVQFHPEKSGSVGLRILDNFMGISAC